MAVHLAEKYGMTLDEARASQARLSAMAPVEGLDSIRSNAREIRSTRIAFSISPSMWGAGSLKRAAVPADFTEGASIADTATLVRLGEEVGSTGQSALRSSRTGPTARRSEVMRPRQAPA